jgi:hypothetical protein
MPVTSDTGELAYLVLADRAVPYLLARVRWPDVAQATSLSNPDWIHDTGLFDLPYDPSAVTVSFTQAASVATSWGRQLHFEAAQDMPSYIRRMPANWSDLSASERHVWGIEFVGRRRAPARRVRLRRSSQGNGNAGVVAGAGEGPGAGAGGQAVDSRSDPAEMTLDLGRVIAERRHHTRVPVDGRAHIRWGPTTISAGLVDLSEGGVQCVLPEAPPVLVPGATLGGPCLLETEVTRWRICLDVAGRITWRRSTGDGTRFGVDFGELGDGEAKGLRQLVTAARRKGSNR